MPARRPSKAASKIFGRAEESATVELVAQKIGTSTKSITVVVAAVCIALGGGCASTEYFYEGPGQPSDRASGQVPAGVNGVCKVSQTKRPPIVNQQIWDDARECTSRTPERFIRIGYGPGRAGATTQEEADKNMQRMLEVLREGPREGEGNNRLVALLRSLHDTGLKDPSLRDRVVRETSRASVCDYSYLLNRMAWERGRLEHGNKCASVAYDPKLRTEICLFDTSRDEVVWLTSSWSCTTHTHALGERASCFQLCGYDDYCAKQVSCAVPDVDLLLCAMGVCVPEPMAGIIRSEPKGLEQ